MFVHAMRRTKPTAPRRTRSSGRTGPTSDSRRPTIVTSSLPLAGGSVRPMAAMSVLVCTRACSGLMPEASRPTTRLIALPRYVGRIFNGVHSSVCGGKLNAGGITPTMVAGTPSMFSTRPITAGSARKRPRHRPSLSTATAAPCSSPSRNTRPRAGARPSSGNRLGVTSLRMARTGSPAPVREHS